jgi:glutamine---fructose-6-phosphate transaminase (isomerizing)
MAGYHKNDMRIDASLLEGGYLRDLLDEPRVLGCTLADLQESTAISSLVSDLERGTFRQIVLTGMGASFHALHPLFLSLNKSGITTLLVETSELIHSMPQVLAGRTLLVVLSQSGRSVEVLRLLELRGRVPTIAITNHADSELAQKAEAVVLTRAGEEFSVSCKTYVASLLAIQWLRGVLCRKDGEVSKEELRPVVPEAEQYLRNWQDHVRELLSELQGVKDLFLVGRGESLAAVGTGGLILKESAKFHAEGMSSAAFRHGPFEIVGPGVFVFIFEGDRASAALNKGLFEDVRRAGGRAALIGAQADAAVYRLPGGWSLRTPILEILPVQMMSLALAAMANRKPGEFKLITKVTTVE